MSELNRDGLKAAHKVGCRSGLISETEVELIVAAYLAALPKQEVSIDHAAFQYALDHVRTEGPMPDFVAEQLVGSYLSYLNLPKQAGEPLPKREPIPSGDGEWRRIAEQWRVNTETYLSWLQEIGRALGLDNKPGYSHTTALSIIATLRNLPKQEPSGDVERLRRAIRGLIDEVALCKYTKACEPLMIAVSEADTALQRSYRSESVDLPDPPKGAEGL